ncbi:MAG: hypothetical protein LAQ69_02830 [Acidobacteriia bacterium]|nr:hypothetical protein [Terriglobia bacterium]
MGNGRLSSYLKSVVPASASTVGAAALPKCPLCVGALLGSIGISIPLSGASLGWLCALLVCVPVALSFIPVCGARRIGPILLSVSSGSLLLLGRAFGVAYPVLAVGIMGLIAASLWRVRETTKGRLAGRACPTKSS